MTWIVGKDSDAVTIADAQATDKKTVVHDYGVPRTDSDVMAHNVLSAFNKNTGPEGELAAVAFFPSQSRAVFEKLLFELPMMIMTMDGQGNIMNANQAVLDVLGYSRDEITGKTPQDLLVSNSWAMLRENIYPVLFETGQFINVDVELVRKNGKTVEMMMSCVAHKNHAGRVEKSIAVFADMSQRAEAQAALRQSEQRFRQSFESAAHGMAILTADGRIATVNVALCEMLDQDEMELSRQYLEKLVCDADQDKLQRLILQVKSGQHAGVNGELRFVGAQGRMVHGLTSISGVGDRFGNIEQLVVQIVDLTSRRRAEEKLRKAQKMEAIGLLTGGIAHDFNNLLTVINGNLQLVEKALEGNENAEKRARNALEAATKGAELTRQLLAFARRQPLAPQEVAVNDLIEKMGSMLSRTIGESIELKVDLMAGNPVIKIDRTQLESAIIKLAINARDAMDDNGKLTIETSQEYIDEDYAREHDEVVAGQYVLIAVSDTGCGMPGHVLDKIFHPFFTTKDVGQGTGLGLSMVFGFIKQSGGFVRVYSEEGHGTAFKMYLPRVDFCEDEAEAAKPAAISKKKILVTEDQEAVRMVAVSFLEDFGYEVIQASNGVEALQILQDQHDIALLFTDVVMPGGMNGFDLSQAAEQICPGLKTIHASGYPKGAMVHQEEPRLKGNLISKPFRREELRRIVAETLGDEIPVE